MRYTNNGERKAKSIRGKRGLERVWKAFDGYCSLWAAHLARCGNCVSGVRSLDLILAEIRELGRSLQSRRRKRKNYMERQRARKSCMCSLSYIQCTQNVFRPLHFLHVLLCTFELIYFPSLFYIQYPVIPK